MQQQPNIKQIWDLQTRRPRDPDYAHEGREVFAGFAHGVVAVHVAPVIPSLPTSAVWRADVGGRAFGESALDVQELGVCVADEG